MNKRNLVPLMKPRPVAMKVDESFYQFLQRTRLNFNKQLPRPIKSDAELTKIIMNPKLVGFKIPILRLRKNGFI
jgi:hypothetical protein